MVANSLLGPSPEFVGIRMGIKILPQDSSAFQHQQRLRATYCWGPSIALSVKCNIMTDLMRHLLEARQCATLLHTVQVTWA